MLGSRIHSFCARRRYTFLSCSRLFPDMKPFVEITHSIQAPATNPGQHYAELNLEDIVDVTHQPAGGDAADSPSSATMSDDAAQLEPLQEPRRGAASDPAAGPSISASLAAGTAQQGPPQDPRRARTHDAMVLPASSASRQQGQPQDPRKSQTLQPPGMGAASASAASAGSPSVDSSNHGTRPDRPQDPRLAAGGPHLQRTLQEQRPPPSSAVQQTEHAGMDHLPGLDDANTDTDQGPSPSRLATQLSELDADEALLYSSAPGKQAKQAEDELEDGEHPEAPEEAVLDAPEQRLLDDDSLMLADADNGAAKPTKGDRLKAHDSTAEVAIPGLDSVEPSESAKQFKNDFPSASLRSANRIQHPSAGRQHAAPSARPHTRQTGASAAHTDQAFLPQSASGHLPVDSFGGEALGIGRDSTEQGQRRQSGPKPITLPAPGRPGNAQRMHGSVPKPITLKPPAAARQGGWGFKPHTTEYKR